MSECVAITDDSSGGRIIKCEWLSSEALKDKLTSNLCN